MNYRSVTIVLDGGRMIRQRITKSKVNHLVDILWYIDEENHIDKGDTIIPTGHIHIIYNLADPYYLIDGKNKTKLPNHLLAGQFKTPMSIAYEKHVKQIGVAIRPSAYYKLFGQYSGFLTNTIIDCRDLDYLISLHECVLKALSNENIGKTFDALELFFEKTTDQNSIDILDDMLSYIDDKKGLIDVKEMAKAYNYSQSSLERFFKKHFGLTPKAHADIIRFRFAMLDEDPTCFFYDQSHFIKACKKYTNKAPKSLANSVELTLKDILGI